MAATTGMTTREIVPSGPAPAPPKPAVAAEADEKAIERRARADKKAAPSAPSPTQAELDAIKDGTFRRNRQVTAEDVDAEYKTR